MNKTVNLSVDGKPIVVEEGQKLLWAVLDNGIYIPHLCGIREKERPETSCRLCFVEVEGLPDPVTSCSVTVQEGMVVNTRSARIDRLVQTGFELLLTNHRLDCARCLKNGGCELQTIAKKRGLKLKLTRLRSVLNESTVDESPANFIFDVGRCVLCGRCIWADRKCVKVGAIGLIRRGMGRRVATFGERPIADSNCTQCGECVKACPVGALVFTK